MLKTYLYVPDRLKEKIDSTAKAQNKSKAEVMRQALEKGITEIQAQGTASAQAMFRLAEIGEKLHPQGPKDLSSKLDKYLWGLNDD